MRSTAAKAFLACATSHHVVASACADAPGSRFSRTHVASRRAIQTELRSEPEGAPFIVEKVSGVRCQPGDKETFPLTPDTRHLTPIHLRRETR